MGYQNGVRYAVDRALQCEFAGKVVPRKPRKPTCPKIRPKRKNMRMLRIFRKTGIKTPEVRPSLAGFLASSGGVVPSPAGSGGCGMVQRAWAM